MRGPEDKKWLEQLETEHDNMRAALSFALESEDAQLALRLARVLGTFWYMHSHSGEGRKWLEAALARDERAPAALRIMALEALYWLAFDRWDHDRTEAIAREANELGAETEIESSLAASLRVMSAGPAWGMGDAERGMEIYEEGAELCRQAGYTFRLPDFLFSLGYQLLLERDFERGGTLNEEAVALCREHGYKRSLNFALDNLGWARTFYEESLAVSKELGDEACASESLDGLACVAANLGEPSRAATMFGAAEAMREALSEVVAFLHTPEEAAWREPPRLRARSQLGEWEATQEAGRTMGLKEAIEYALYAEEPSATALHLGSLPRPNLRPGLRAGRSSCSDWLQRG